MSRYIDTKWLEDNAKEYSLGYYDYDEYAVPLSALDEAPSIDIDRPQGEWLDYNGKPTTANYSGTCSVCGTWSEYLLNYCPQCGCRMKGADDE